MTESSQRLTPQPPETAKEFPNGNAKDGVAYQMANPANPLQQLVIMSMESYVAQGTMIQALRQTNTKQDARIRELLAEHEVLQRMCSDTRTRLENLRAVRRAEKRPEIEALVETPPGYLTPPKGE